MATIEELSAALVKADAAGNAADAKAFADAIRSMRASEVAPASNEGMPKPRTAAQDTAEELKTAKTAKEAFDISQRNFRGNIEAAGKGALAQTINIGGNIYELVGKGIKAIGGEKAGQALQDVGAIVKAGSQNISAPYVEKYPTAVSVGGLAADVGVTMPVGGAIGALLKTAAPYAKFITPIAEATASGGFKTGLAPTGAVKATTGLPSYTIKDIAAETGARAAGGAISTGAATAITHPEDVGTGVIFGAALPTAGAAFAKAGSAGAGKFIDFISGRGAEIKAANIARMALGDSLVPATIALANARPGITAVQALQEAGINPRQFMALGLMTEKSSIGNSYVNLAKLQEQTAQNQLTTMAGGRTQTEIAESLKANKNALNDVTTPMRETALDASNQANKTISQLSPRIAQKEASMVDALQGQGQAATNAAQQTNLARGGVIPERLGGTGKVSPSAYNAAIEGLPPSATLNAKRAAESSVLSTEMAALKAQRQAERDFLQNQVGSLEAHGLKPLNIDPIIKTIDSKLADPNLYGQTQLLNVLRGLRDDFMGAVSANGGVADARALYSMRKAGISQKIDEMYGSLDPSSKQRLTADVLASVKSPIDKAIVDAGGTGWNRYLQTFETGMHEIGQQKLAAIALDRFKNDKEGFLRLVRGNDTKAIEDVFGYGSANIFKEMGRKSGQLETIAKDLERDIAIKESANSATQSLARIMGMSESKIKGVPAFFNKTATTINAASKILRDQINQKTFDIFEKGMISGKSAAEMLAVLPTSERNKVFNLLKNSSEWNPNIANVTTQIHSNKLAAPVENRNSLRQQ